jgi:hypothetical protein
MEPFGFFFVFIAIAILIRLMAGSFDGERVEAYINKNGWKLVDKSWDPFGPGWFGEKDARIYQVVYEDQQGDLHKAHAKTSMLSGVYLTNARIVQRSERIDHSGPDALLSENERLKARIRELEQNEGR